MDSMHDILTGLNVERKPHLRVLTTDYGVCAKCKGAGYLRANVPYGHPAFGKAQMCECKLAAKKAETQQTLLEVSGIVGLKWFAQASFETFVQLDGCKPAYRAAITYAANPSGWLVLLGGYGCGKTHLAVSVARRRIVAGDTVLVQTVPDLLDHLRSSFSPHTEQSYTERFEQMRNVDLLVLDDYGAENTTDWATEKLFQLLNHRYNAALATVITSNNITLTGIDPRISSRLHDQELVTHILLDEARDYRVYGNCEE